MTPKVLIAVALFAGLLLVWYLSDTASGSFMLFDPAQLEDLVRSAGVLGPATVIALMAVAIVFSPIPSAPLAIAAGAAYGHSWGTVYILVGAEIGALIAFGIARFLGRNVAARLAGRHLSNLGLMTQTNLTIAIFLARLVPFLSFDVISYAAGLTQITVGRFALATLAGMIPASFLLAHLGSLTTTDEGPTTLITLALLAIGSIAVSVFAIRKKNSPTDDEVDHAKESSTTTR